MLVKPEDTYRILNEAFPERLDITKDAASIANKFTTKPQGFLIQDTYNNPFLPVRPRPRVDTSKMDLIEVYKRVRENYGKFASIFLPWHYICEFVGNRYYIFNTRPIDVKFPLTNKQLSKLDDTEWDDLTKLFFKEKIFDISEGIHICIIGDTSLDIYTKKTYEAIGRMCMAPFMRYFKLPRGLFQRTFPLNVGKKFNLDYLTKFVKR